MSRRTGERVSRREARGLPTRLRSVWRLAWRRYRTSRKRLDRLVGARPFGWRPFDTRHAVDRVRAAGGTTDAQFRAACGLNRKMRRTLDAPRRTGGVLWKPRSQARLQGARLERRGTPEFLLAAGLLELNGPPLLARLRYERSWLGRAERRARFAAGFARAAAVTAWRRAGRRLRAWRDAGRGLLARALSRLRGGNPKDVLPPGAQ